MDGAEWITNRERKRQPRRVRFPRMGCDRALVPETSKCPVCGYRNGRKRAKR